MITLIVELALVIMRSLNLRSRELALSRYCDLNHPANLKALNRSAPYLHLFDEQQPFSTSSFQLALSERVIYYGNVSIEVPALD